MELTPEARAKLDAIYGQTPQAETVLTPEVRAKLDAIYGQQSQEQPPIEQGQVEPNLFDKIEANRLKREQAVRNAPNLPSAGIEALRYVVGAPADIGGAVIGSAAKTAYGALPEFIQQPIERKASEMMQYPIVQKAAGLLSQAVGGAEKMKQRNPITGGLIGLGMDVANTLPFAKPIAAAAELGIKGAGMAAKAATPSIGEGLLDVAILAKKHDIPLSVNQVSGSNALKNIQKVSQELPASGQESFRNAQLKQWNKGLLKTVGVEGDRITKMNMDKAFTNVGREFDNLGKGKTFQLGDDFTRGLDDIRTEAESIYTQEAIKNFENEASNVLKEAGATGEISGEKLSLLRSRINRLARKTNNPDTAELLHDLENKLIDTMTVGDDAAKAAFSETKQKYKNLIVLEPLAAKAKGGNISPALLNARVAKVYGRQHVTGKAGDISELAQIGSELLPELGGSDTLQKAAYLGGATGGFVTAPLSTIATLSGNRAYQSFFNRNQALVKKMIEKGITQREIMNLPPKDAKTMMDIVKKGNK